tara:strand:- start:58 stop:339 length:282 start_codon:yes stop_codon:yes gene_type:complete
MKWDATLDMYHACRYKEGKTYAVTPGRGKKSVARIRITKVTPFSTVKAACKDSFHGLKEGFRDEAQFMCKWAVLYRGRNLTCPVWVIDFEFVE